MLRNTEFQKIKDILERAYPSDSLALSFKGEASGDTLADFVHREMKDVYDPDQSLIKNIELLADSLLLAVDDLENLVEALYRY